MLIESIHDISYTEDYIVLKFILNLHVGTVEEIFLSFYFSYYTTVPTHLLFSYFLVLVNMNFKIQKLCNFIVILKL